MKIMEHVREGLLLGCGNPLLDISAKVDESFLQKYDLEPDNAILAEEKHKPLYDELTDKYNAEFIAGGSVQNTFRVAQWILQKPNVAVFFGCVGSDKFSKILENKARTDGVNVQYQYNPETPTGTCGVLITGKNRSLCANLSAANHFTIDHLYKAENQKLIQNAEYFYISGFFLTVSLPTILEVADFALKNNRIFMMNLSAPFLSLVFNDRLQKALPFVDILFGNETEAETFAQAQSWNTKDLKEIGRKIVKLPKNNLERARVVVITQGQNPVLLFHDDKITEFPVELLKSDQVVDTNGAGDAFVGGFIAQYVQRKPFDVCVRCGIWTAREIIQRSGCTFDGIPTFKE